jgi:amino acid transporter
MLPPLVADSQLSCVSQYWKNPGAFNQLGLEPTNPNLDRFLAIMSSIVQAAFGFAGMEIVSLPRFPRFGSHRSLSGYPS